MYKSRARRWSVVAVVVGACALAGTAGATTPQEAQGQSFLLNRVVTSVQQAGPNTILTIVDTRLYVRTISGTSVDTLTVTVDASGGFGFHGTSLCSCAIAGHPGTVVMTINGKGQPDGTFADRRETLAASATGAPDGVRLNVSVAGVGGVGQYAGGYHFEG